MYSNNNDFNQDTGPDDASITQAFKTLADYISANVSTRLQNGNTSLSPMASAARTQADTEM